MNALLAFFLGLSLGVIGLLVMTLLLVLKAVRESKATREKK